MPGNPPPVADEREALMMFLRQQRNGLRNAAFGLTEEQAHTVPSRSAIAIANLLKHAATTERGWVARARSAPGVPEDGRSRQELVEQWGSDWDASGQTVAELLELIDDVERESEETLAAVDLDTPVPVPRDAPWFPKDVEAWSVRWVYFHIIEELARHAGHGDIVREHLDGATMYELMAAAEGWPESPWLKPWRPSPDSSAIG